MTTLHCFSCEGACGKSFLHGRYYAFPVDVPDDQNDAVDGSGVRAWSASDRDYTYDEVWHAVSARLV